ncbi:unnamed protein product, partial [Brenthis ino]
MLRNYITKTNRGVWLEDSMIKALDVVKRKVRKGKEVSNKRKTTSYILESESSEEEEDTECLFCSETFSKDNMGELWIKCFPKVGARRFLGSSCPYPEDHLGYRGVQDDAFAKI